MSKMMEAVYNYKQENELILFLVYYGGEGPEEPRWEKLHYVYLYQTDAEADIDAFCRDLLDDEHIVDPVKIEDESIKGLFRKVEFEDQDGVHYFARYEMKTFIEK